MKIILADDHSLFREGLRSLLEPQARCFEAASLVEMQALLQSHADIDLVLMDLKIPGLTDLVGVEALRAQYPHIPLVVVSLHDEPEIIQAALAHGIAGYIPKSHNFESMCHAIDLVLSGLPYVPQEVLNPNGHLCGAMLTPRQQQIYALLMQGKSNQEIADALGISLSTVKMHVGTVLEKNGSKSRTQLLANSHHTFF